MKEKARLRSFPGEKFSETMLTADGRHMAVSKPEKTRNTMSYVPFSERPQAMQKILWKKQPSRKMSLLPSASETAPKMRRVQPVASAYMDTRGRAYID